MKMTFLKRNPKQNDTVSTFLKLQEIRVSQRDQFLEIKNRSPVTQIRPNNYDPMWLL